MEVKTEYHGRGVGFIGLLTLVFITLKLCGIITWPWLWVLSPIWICVILVLLVYIIVLAAAIIANR